MCDNNDDNEESAGENEGNNQKVWDSEEPNDEVAQKTSQLRMPNMNYLIKYDEEREKIFPFDSKFVRRLFHNKHLLFVGDSLTRAIYKDVVLMLQTDELLDDRSLKSKTEFSHMNDRMIDYLPLEQDRVFQQAREYQTSNHLVQFVFTSRTMKRDVEQMFQLMHQRKDYPSVIVMNSCIWDITRYNVRNVNIDGVEPYDECPRGQIVNETNSMQEYLQRISMLVRRFQVFLPAATQVIWAIYPWPVRDGTGFGGRTGSLDKRHLHRSLCCDANYRAAQIIRNAGYDVVDFGFYMRNHALYGYRVKDGVHWDAIGTRFMTQLLINHISMNVKLPPIYAKRLQSFSTSLLEFGGEAVKFMNHRRAAKCASNPGELLQLKLRELVLQKHRKNDIKTLVKVLRFLEVIRKHKLLKKMKPATIGITIDFVNKSLASLPANMKKIRKQVVTVRSELLIRRKEDRQREQMAARKPNYDTKNYRSSNSGYGRM